jgi:PAS domain S-box-containing protein
MFKGKKTANKRRKSVGEEYPKTKLFHVNKNASKASSKLPDKSSFGESLEQLQELQSSILSAIPHAVVGLKDRTIFFANEAVERVFGWKPDKIIGQKTELLYRSEKDFEEIGRRFYPLLETQRTHTEDFPCRRKDGQEILCRISASVIGQGMSEKGIVVMYEDITKQKRVESNLLESEIKYRAVFDNTGTAMIIIEEDATISLANAEVEKISGYSRGAIEGKMSWSEFVMKEDIGKMQYYHSLRRNDPEAAPGHYEFRLIDKYGNVKQISLTIAMIPGTKKSIASIMDITDRAQAEKKLQESERKYRELVQNANSIILRWNRAGEVTFLNEFGQKFFGYSEAEILGRHVVGTIVPEAESTGRDLSPLMDKITAHPEDFEKNINENMRRNGDRVWISWTNKVVKDNEGQVLEILSIGSDITERKRTEAELEKYRLHLEELVNERTADLEAKTNELERSQKALQVLLEDINKAKKELEAANERLKELDRLKSMFIASMSHELRTPLNSIIGFTGMTLQGLSGELNDEQNDNLARVYQSAKHLLALITDVIDISKIEAGRIDVFPEEVSLKNIVDEAVSIVEPQLKEKRLTLAVDVPADVKLNTDRKRLLQCLINFLSNGVKFTEKGGITITARELNADLEIAVTDTGIGIAKKDMPKLFEAFERLDTHLRVKAGGTGLGLYLTKKLTTDILQGSVSVQSIEGQGSTFILRVPRDLHQGNKIGDMR